MISLFGCVFFFKHKTAYEMRISDWSSDVCSSDLSTLGKRAPCSVRSPSNSAICCVSGSYAPPRLKGEDRTSVVQGKRVSVSVDLGGRRINKKKINVVNSKILKANQEA